ncbi:MAG TPA: hypothetical protein VIG41_04530, partial [Micrococcaceae bacterium]
MTESTALRGKAPVDAVEGAAAGNAAAGGGNAGLDGAEAGGNPQASDQFVQSLARGLAVIRTFDAGHPEMTL